MLGPARAGLFVYAKDLEKIAKFYEAVAGMSRLHKTDELIVLQSSDIQLLVHKIPEHISKEIIVKSPPEKRENIALKFFFTVPSIEKTRVTAENHEGKVLNDSFKGPGFVVCNATDPEGNVFHIRELYT